MTDLGYKIATMLKEFFSKLSLVLKKPESHEVWWLDARVELIPVDYFKYAGRITIGFNDIWLYLTDDQRRKLEKYVVLTFSGRLYSEETMKKLLKMGIKIPGLELLLEKMKGLLVSVKELKRY